MCSFCEEGKEIVSGFNGHVCKAKMIDFSNDEDTDMQRSSLLIVYPIKEGKSQEEIYYKFQSNL